MKKLYKVILEDNVNVYREFIPAENEEAAKQYVEGNGDIISITDVTEDYPISISFLKVTLDNAHYGKAEIDLITRLVQQYKNVI